MKNRFILFLSLFAILTACDTSNNVDPVYKRNYIMYYGAEGEQRGVDLVVNADGSMILLGNSTLPSGLKNTFVLKVDPEGNVIWEKNIGSDGELAIDIELIKAGSNAGKFIIATNRGDLQNSRINLHIIDQSGNVDGDGTEVPIHPGGVRQVVKSITSLDLGGFIITGYADGTLIKESSPGINETNDNQDILVFELNEMLAITDTVVTKGGELNGSGVRVFQLPAASLNKYVLFGYSDRPYNSGNFTFKYTYDILASGVPIGKVIGSETEENILSTTIETPLAPGAGFLMAGTSKTSGSNGEIFLVKLNSTLDTRTFERKLDLGKNMQSVDIDNATDGFYVLANEIVEDGKHNINLIKTGMDGADEWTKSFGTPEGDDEAAAVATLPDGRIAIVGTMELQTKRKLALIVVNKNGDL
jgi:hypothetical protein